MFQFFKQKMNNKGQKQAKDFYVHEMLAGFRHEPVPAFFKPRHVRRVEKEVFSAKPVFADWLPDTSDSIQKACSLDVKYMNYEKFYLEPAEIKQIEKSIFL